MKTPKFWEENKLKAKLLTPLSFFYKKATENRVAQEASYKANIPVICVGNITAGGAGKTPTAIAIAELLKSAGKKPNFVSKGHGRKSEETLIVDSQAVEIIGDEPKLLAKIAPTIVSANRIEGAKQAEQNGAELIILDDGFQDPSLEKNLSLLVIDGKYGIGNGKIIPAGPLRESFEAAVERADAIIVIGELKKPLPATSKPVFKANLEITIPEEIKEEDIVAYCGIGLPEKFYDSLKKTGLNIKEELSFPDHHFYSEEDFRNIFAAATNNQAVVATTEKDYVKVPENLKKLIYNIKAKLVFENEAAVLELLKKCLD